MSSADAATPLSVDDVMAQLLTTHGTHHAKEPDSSHGTTDDSNAALPSPSAPVRALPATIADTHRVQVAIRGRRYETSMAVAVTYCLTFYAFFRCPFAHGKTVGEVFTGSTTADVSSESDGRDAAASEALLRHHVEVVEPLLLRFLRHQQQQQACTESGETFVPPALPRPVSITYDPAGTLWKFEYPARLSAEAEAAERQRRQRTAAVSGTASTAAAAAATPINTDELNSSPFLLLQSDYMGVLLVYLRRCAKVRAERTEGGSAPHPSYPALPIRWQEMSYDDQVSFLQLLRAFGVVSLTATFARPTAALSTSHFVGADAARVAAADKAEGDACSLRVKANEFWQLQQRQHEAESESELHHMKRAGRRVDDEDDGVELLPTGCARCGMAGHATAACPY